MDYGEFIKQYNLHDITFTQVLKTESNDRQFLALRSLWLGVSGRLAVESYLFLVITNALVCYQLSGKGEDYWEEFAECVAEELPTVASFGDVVAFFSAFLPNSVCNKRLVEVKLKRVEKLREFYAEFIERGQAREYYNDMLSLAESLASVMRQRVTDKTILFAIKMFGYAGRVVYGKFIQYPFELSAPIDSRLIKLAPKGLKNITEVREFYNKIAKELQIPPLHLDAILWNYFNL